MKAALFFLLACSAMAQKQSFYQLQIIPLGSAAGSISLVDPISGHSSTVTGPTNLLADVAFRFPGNNGLSGNPLVSDGAGGTSFTPSLSLDKLTVDTSILLNGSLGGSHAQNVGTGDSPKFYVPSVSKLSLTDYSGLSGAVAFGIVAFIHTGSSVAHADIIDQSGNALFTFASLPAALNTSLANLNVGTVGTPKNLTVTGTATVQNLVVTGTTSGIHCSASTSTSTSPAFCTNGGCSTTATVTYVSGVSVSCP